MMSDLLISEPPLQVLPSLANYLKSADKAIMVQQIFYWQQKSTNIHDGHKWVYNTVKEWHQQFPWLSEKTVQRYLKDLEDKKILITANYNKAKFDRTKWYRVNKDALDNLGSRKGLPVPTKGTDSPNLKGTSCPDLYHRLPETTTENTTEDNMSSSHSTKSYSDEIKIIVDYLNQKAGTRYRSTSQKTQRLIKARINEGATVDNFKQVIDLKVSQWSNSAKMSRYLRPETLFGTHFEGYLNEKPQNAKPQINNELGW